MFVYCVVVLFFCVNVVALFLVLFCLGYCEFVSCCIVRVLCVVCVVLCCLCCVFCLDCVSVYLLCCVFFWFCVIVYCCFVVLCFLL